MTSQNIKSNDLSNNKYMFNHIGGIKKNSQLLDNIELDTNIDYTKEQKLLIDANKKTIYQKKPYDNTFDTNNTEELGLNVIQDRNPMGVNMLSNHADAGLDSGNFQSNITKNGSEYDPYIDWLHKKGLMGQKKSRYNTHYINVDSEYRNKTTLSKPRFRIKINDNALSFNGAYMRIALADTNNFKLNDKITIEGVSEKKIVVRSTVKDDYGYTNDYFALVAGKQYMTVTANNNMLIDARFTDDVKKTYDNMMVSFSGFIGDKKTQWVFNTKNYIWDVTNSDVSGTPAFTVRITENVWGVTSASSNLPEVEQIRADVLIAEFQVDLYGTVLSILQLPYNIDDIRWTIPPNMGNANPIGVTNSYNSLIASKLNTSGLNKVPNVPTSIYITMQYFQDVQNAIRPIFKALMNNSLQTNFHLRYTQHGAQYIDSVQFIDPVLTQITTHSMIGNISLNLINNVHRMFLTSADVEHDLGINADTSIVTDELSSQKFYIKLYKKYEPRKIEFNNPLQSGALLVTIYENTISDVMITYHHHGGIPIKNINTSYPLGFTSAVGFAYVIGITPYYYITIDLKKTGFLSGTFGGNDVYISLIEDIIIGYPQPNSYIVDLEKEYSNIVMVRMVSSTFPITQKVFMDEMSGTSKNNSFYWQNIDDGDIVYKISIDTGNYTPDELKRAFELAVQQIPRVNDNVLFIQNNVIVLDIDAKTDKVTFSSFNKYQPGYILTYRKQIRLSIINANYVNNNLIDSEDAYYQYPRGGYYENFQNTDLICDAIRIKIYHPNHSMSIKDNVTIKDSLNYGYISEKYLNQTHIITRVDADYYDILLCNVNTDVKLDIDIVGGEEIKLYTPNLFRIRFDYQYTMGNELGFRDVGQETSITPYQSMITNDVLYEGEDLASVLSNKIQYNILNVHTLDIATNPTLRNALSLNGPSHIIIKCKELIAITGAGIIKDYFCKINLSGKLNEYVYDSFVNSAIIFNDPIDRITELTINIVMSNGLYYNFNGKDHSFVLELTTYNPIPVDSHIRT